MKTRFLFLGTLFIALTLLSACGKSDSLNGTHWQLAELNGAPVLTDAIVTLNFESGNLGGSDGCNTYGGSFTAKGSSFTVGTDIFSTMMYCSDTINVQATAFYSALNQAAEYRIDGGSLSLLDSSGNVLALFVSISQ